MQISSKYPMLFFSFLILNSCNKHAFEDAMIEFDKAFIPVFFYTYNNDLENAEKAMLVLDNKWRALDTQFEKETSNVHNWQESFQMVSNWLDEADCAIKNENADLALVQLDHARYELMDLRWREGMTYYLDKVWDLEMTIDIVLNVSNDSMLGIMEWEKFVPMVYDVENAWTSVLNNTWEKEHFDFDAKTLLEETVRKSALGFAIKDFVIAVKGADRCEVEDTAKEMEAAYLEYMLLFGDFDAIKAFYAAN